MLGSKTLWSVCMISLSLSIVASRAESQQKNTRESFEILREQLIKNVLVPNGVKDPRVLKSVGETPRHAFVPKNFVKDAYLDIAIPIGEAQTISSPYTVALMTQSLDPQPTDKVLEIGTGSGYQAAILSPLVQDVYTIEIVQDLGQHTKQLLADMNYTNVHCLIGDGFKGWPEHAPFDKIIVTCSPEKVPEPLVEQLKEGGLMIVPIGERYQQMLFAMRKVNGKLEREALQPILFVPMTGAAEDARLVKADPRNPKLINGDFELPLINNSRIPGWYYQFGCASVQDPNSINGVQVIEFRSTDHKSPSMLLQGLAIDGSVVKKINLGGWIETENVHLGRTKDNKENREQSPAIAIQFFDSNRSKLGYNYIGGFSGTRKWKKEERILPVPPTTKEVIVSIGLFGATGVARFDGIFIEAVK
ncbi:MAG: protein-L-isoaspartate(D-aspartate) O-methyltransferase [Planctomycetota bacterium]|nr:protein-L-isoaspartate(D-aspartate) O-methyltransferase [Planctomycetota bacterium]